MNQNLNPQQFYHGSPNKLKRGQHVEPRSGGESGGRNYAFFSTNSEEARSWGKAKTPYGQRTYNYRVSPTGHYEADPDSDASKNLRSTSPLKVVSRYPYIPPRRSRRS